MKDRNYAIVFAYLRKYPDLTKEDIAHQYSGGRTTSLKGLKQQEYQAMLRALQSMMQDQEALRKARSIALRLMQEYGIDTRDWGRINHFCSNPRIAGKVFAKLTIEELRALSRKMREIISKDKERRRRIFEEAREKHGGNITIIATYSKQQLIGEA